MFEALLRVLDDLGVPWYAWARAWLRVIPTVTLVPALGARFVPLQSRAVLGLALALLLVPALGAAEYPNQELPSLFHELVRGVPPALSASALLWGASAVGSLFDDLRAASASQVNVVAEAASPMGTLFSLFSSLCFLETGGVARLLEALTQPLPVGLSASWLYAVQQINAGVYLAFSVLAPVFVVALLSDAASALAARAASPAPVQGVFSPLRNLLLLVSLALLLPSICVLLAQRIFFLH